MRNFLVKLVVRWIVRKQQHEFLLRTLWREVDEYYFAPPADRYFGINDYLMDEYKRELEENA